jgi:succinyl-diaminopimelate desuccinylase
MYNFNKVLQSISNTVNSYRDEIIKTLMDLISIPAISPDYGYDGEYEKAERLMDVIKSWGFDKIEVFNANDPRAKNGVRPNIVAYYYGEHRDSQRIWVLSHLDVVPPGDLSQWTVTKPFTPVFKDGKIFGRGAEDNGQAIASSLYAVKTLIDLDIRPKKTLILAFVSDEETGSRYGIEWLIKNHRELFQVSDQALVPDYGVSDGSCIEVAEKSILWVRIKVKGRQTHASTPHRGLNAHRVAVDLVQKLDRFLHEKYSAKDMLFDPSESTFEPTISLNSAKAPNIIPGDHEFTFDCRILPIYRVDDVVFDINRIAGEIRNIYRKNGYPDIEIEIIQREDAPKPTDPNSEIVQQLKKAIKMLRGIDAKIIGIGGGTVAAAFRRIGIPAAVWSTIDDTAHEPNEYAKVDNIIEDAKVIAALSIL